jgi:hypothetical protein
MYKLGLADKEDVHEEYWQQMELAESMRRERDNSVNYVIRAHAQKLFNDGGNIDIFEEEMSR